MSELWTKLSLALLFYRKKKKVSEVVGFCGLWIIIKWTIINKQDEKEAKVKVLLGLVLGFF